MTKWFPALDDVINDIVNVWEGDSIENVLTDDPDLEGSVEKLAEKIEDDMQAGDPLPTWLDPNIELSDVGEEVEKTVKYVSTAVLDLGFGKSSQGWWPLSIPLTIAAIGALVVISR